VVLCRESVGPDDYVPDFVDDFLATGVVFLAEESGRAVGMMVYHDIPDGGVWLHAARTHPDQRKQGVATALMSACERLARERSRTAMRLWAEADNAASVAANRKYGYEERARFTRMRVSASRPGPAVRLAPFDVGRDWGTLKASPFLARSAGYLFHDFYFLPLTRRTAEWLGRDGALWRWGDTVVSISEDFHEARGRDLQVQLLAGDPAAILRAAPSIARNRGADRVESFLPHDRPLLETARDTGFDLMDWGREAVLFEKPLPAKVR
jgi:GNAT superfamily N-acetyltransferase